MQNVGQLQEPSSPIQALGVNPFPRKVIYRNRFRGKFVTPSCLIGNRLLLIGNNQPQRSHSHAHLHMLFHALKKSLTTMAESMGEFYFHGEACSKNNSLREWVDSRVQHIWRLRDRLLSRQLLRRG